MKFSYSLKWPWAETPFSVEVGPAWPLISSLVLGPVHNPVQLSQAPYPAATTIRPGTR
jgi:hypothetical protein